MSPPDWKLFLTALLTTFPALFTPGPNIALSISAAFSYGFRGAMPYALGVGVGYPLVVLVAGFGLGNLFQIYPVLHTAAKYFGLAFLLYLSYKIALAPAPTDNNSKPKTYLGFKFALLFQWVNPKGIAFAITLVSLYTRPDALLTDVPLLMVIAAVWGFGSCATWAAIGAWIKQHLNTPFRFRCFSVVMGLMLCVTAVAILL